MTKEQIIRFVHKVQPGIPIKFYRGKKHKYSMFGGYYNDSPPTIYVNERIVFIGDKRQTSYNYITALLMHELGHHNTYDKSIVEREYKAQVWAINRAKKLGMTRISRNLKRFLKEELSFLSLILC